jgi:hypothetical protein
VFKEYAGIALAAELQRYACFIPDSLALLMLLLCCRLVGTPIYFGLQLVELVVSWSAAAACAQQLYECIKAAFRADEPCASYRSLAAALMVEGFVTTSL